jgi:hypothetical protein
VLIKSDGGSAKRKLIKIIPIDSCNFLRKMESNKNQGGLDKGRNRNICRD